MKINLIALLVLITYYVSGQPIESGAIHYKETVKLNIDFGDNPEMAKMVPPSQTFDKVLYFNKGESLFMNAAKPKDLEINQEENGQSMQIVMKVPESKTYTNLNEDLFVQYQDLMGKDFLIKDKVKKTKWKLTGEQMKILDFVCQKAIPADTSKHLVVWYTPQIPVGVGPNDHAGLPGIILGLDLDEGQRTIFATKYEPLAANFTFDRPQKGKKVNREEFEKIREEKMKEMGAVNGKGSGVKMIIREERH